MLLLTSCRSSTPPKIEICILDGHGGGDCIETDGTRKYRLPSEMVNYWATGQNDEANFSAWCYQTTAETSEAIMNHIEKQARPWVH